MTTATPTLPTSVDADFQVTSRIAWMFAPHEQSTPNMTVRLDSGALFNGTNLTEVTGQNTAAITAPSLNPRIDRVVIDQASGSVSVVTGTEASSPLPPAISAGKVPIAQVLLQTSSTAITNAMLIDERVLNALGLGSIAFQNANNVSISGGTISNATIGGGTVSGLSSPIAITDGGTGATTASGARVNLGLGSAATANTSDFLQTANNLSDVSNVATARTNLGLGTIATQDAGNVTITGGSITGIADLAVADGGTGVSTLTAHGVVIGNGASAVHVTGTGSTGQVLTSNGASADPTFQALPSSGTVTSITAGFGLTGGTIATSGTIALQSTVGAVGTYAFLLDNGGSLGTTYGPGTTRAGSNLLWVGVGGGVGGTDTTAGSPSGTWQLMGASGVYPGCCGPNQSANCSVWLRIS